MTTIRLIDARRGLNRKCEELFGNAKIAEAIYCFLCDGIEECEDAEPERKKGNWYLMENLLSSEGTFDGYFCSVCDKGFLDDLCCNNGADFVNIPKDFKFCPFCGADMREETEDGSI